MVRKYPPPTFIIWTSLVEKLTMWEERIKKNVYKRVLVEDTVTDQTAGSNVLEFRIKCDSSDTGWLNARNILKWLHLKLSVVMVTRGYWIDETSKNGPELKEIKEVKSNIFVWLHFLSF